MRTFMSALCLLLVIGNAYGWGKTGHRVTGAVAESFLSDNARQGIRDILGVEGLAESSDWPDFMRSSPEEFWQRDASPFHYVTIPEGQTYADVGPPEEGDGITALGQFSKTVKSADASLEEKQLALRFIVHIIGDLHQPLHVGNGTDRGGNDFLVTFFGEVSNLHSVWDSKLLEDEQLSYSELSHWLTARITPELFAEWNEADPLIWVAESAKIRDTIYPEQRDIRWDYIFNHRHIWRTRLSQGGVRIAAYLNQLFAED